MPFIIAFAVVVLSVIIITYRTYMSYGDYAWYTKISFLLFLLISFFAPFISHIIRNHISSGNMLYLTKFLYFLFGFAFLLFVITFVRDILWTLLDLVRHVSTDEMKNPPLLQKINIMTVVVCLCLCLYGYYEAEKTAKITSYDIVTPKVKKPTKVVALSDLHIDIDVSPEYVARLVERVNALNPDAILLVGDIVDNAPKKLASQMAELKKLKAKENVFFVLGNHEYYSGPMQWGIALSMMGFHWLGNQGKKLGDTGVYIAGLHDISSTNDIKIGNALYKADKDDYVIVMEHTPKIAEGITKENVDLQISAHTHGGQIYPFHYLVKKTNDGHLAGFYDVNGVKLYVTRGTRYWGPPIRIFAPSEITVFNLTPETKNDK